MSANEESSSIQQIMAGVLLLGVAGFGLYDFSQDLQNGSPAVHLIVEACFSILGLFGSFWILIQAYRLRKELQTTKQVLARVSAESANWRHESSRLMAGLSQAIDTQLVKWNLSPAEKEIALLLLKGFSMKEIASLRNVAERTVRQQTVSIYAKSGLNGRAEFSAFFLEDLMLPSSSIAQK